ncbi:hypothetical protein EMPS_02151 [Entomortierella parvispora]|uniref:Uncharacterized protein n=1 Tax=Entomortierella parvispora TaxID=205924 RepID=A0A9P3LTG3_9FUNG|nr:hypothetical protein EMPS_02151 [Entomortierella parvispora]
MFARQIDPFQAYNSALSAAQRHHKDLLEKEDLQHQHDLNQRLGQVQQPEMDASKRRKRSFVFEPDFLSALDSAAVDMAPSAGPKRPCKKARRSSTLSRPILSPHISSPELVHPAKSAPSTKKTSTASSHGPSIIDLSSGEELVALHVGESEHKRRRESNACSPDEDYLREVFDVQEDGSLCETMHHAPALPSPTKRARLEKPRPHLQFLDQSEPKDKSKYRGRMDHIRNRQTYRNNKSARSSAEMDAWMSDDEEPGTPLPIFKPESQALVRYQGPKSMSLAEGVDTLLKHRLIEDSNDIYSLQDPRGHELVLYRGYRGSDSLAEAKVHTTESSSTTVIEELDDADDDNATASNSATSLMDELQDKIMDMDLD